MICPYCPPEVRRQQALGAAAACFVNFALPAAIIAIMLYWLRHR